MKLGMFVLFIDLSKHYKRFLPHVNWFKKQLSMENRLYFPYLPTSIDEIFRLKLELH